MTHRRRILILLAMILLPGACAAALDAPQQFADIGDLPLASGQTLLDVRIGYRTAGALNEERSNIIVFPSWYGGTTADLLRWEKIGPRKLADSDRWFVVAVDSLGNGVSTSPSNSARQPGESFPEIAIDDMVNATHALLTRHLGIGHVHAVMGISMGGMQAFQWVGQYPGFMDKAVPVDGSPQSTSYDLAQWQVHADAIRLLREGGIDDARILEFLSSLGLLTLWTPEYYLRTVTPKQWPEFRASNIAGSAGKHPLDYLAQLRAMMSHDAYADFDGAGAGYVNRIQAGMLVVGVPSDHMVNPVPGKDLAVAVGARYAEIESDCGHIGSSCEGWKVEALVRTFLAQ